jgi:hypothetical protein
MAGLIFSFCMGWIVSYIQNKYWIARKSRKLALKEVQDILNDKDIPYAWHMAHLFIREELKK